MRAADRSDPVTYPLSGRRRATPIRLTLAGELGRDIDGAWWPRTDRISGELPDLVAALGSRLGEICGITINWPHLQRPPDLNWQGWQHKNQHVIVLQSEKGCANVLIVPYTTNSALAMMVLRRAANLPIALAEQESTPFRTAGSILCAAQQQRAADGAVPVPAT
ncbi:hypothetical protein Mkiyose1665_10130 [Mycobacterium kiyosense]|uniref:Uncharacterized protein n=1 Tax=Mycobacterium kiyosense TaxID=2871094 RepID=A0AA37PWZ1_9MYCO|nr:hypothetical protein IWGMT90018_17000 [Mycobacterium kiyosense]GLB82868.1 hypothetical protein SRL2020028_21240 [Mycobacterium kiyosense]GLB92129.1 hypothetical protein SRL2020130_49460 [Mycobacterium kiyosense]GLC04423.1 hypothetical protein SRL2020400_50140 [Mycobacterium kiyosense]GLC22585.1 hypothetical protein SRL2020472_51560 [Mycobacterium kiyosense]